MRTLLASRAIALAAATMCAPLGHAQTTLRSFSELLRDMTRRVDKSIVQIVTREYAATQLQGESPIVRPRQGNGSGVVVDSDGLIVTNAHVVGQARRVEVLLPPPDPATSGPGRTGKLVTAEVLGLDRETDVAVLRVPEKQLPFLRFADSSALHQGELVFAFGSPFGLENSVSMGVVSSASRQIAADDPMAYIQTDAAVNPGNSGGPLVNTNGDIVGINTFIISASGVNAGVGFAVPANLVKTVFDQIVKYGRVRRGQIGVVAQSITPTLQRALGLDRDWGVIVADVRPRGSAEAAGIQVKDVLLSLDGKILEDARQFGLSIYGSTGQTVSVELLRDGKKIRLGVAVLERPRDSDQILSLADGPQNILTKLGIVALDLDEKVTPLLPDLRRLSGVVVAGTLAIRPHGDRFLAGDVIYEINNIRVRSLADLSTALEKLNHGDAAAALIERGGQTQYLVFEVE